MKTMFQVKGMHFLLFFVQQYIYEASVMTNQN